MFIINSRCLNRAVFSSFRDDAAAAEVVVVAIGAGGMGAVTGFTAAVAAAAVVVVVVGGIVVTGEEDTLGGILVDVFVIPIGVSTDATAVVVTAASATLRDSEEVGVATALTI